MTRLIYDEEVGMSDVLAARQALDDIASCTIGMAYRFGNDAYFREWQTAIVQGRVRHDQVVAIFPDGEHRFNEYGVLVGDPPTRLWFMGQQAAKLMSLQTSKRKAIRETN